jgi:hypothetical protein
MMDRLAMIKKAVQTVKADSVIISDSQLTFDASELDSYEYLEVSQNNDSIESLDFS